MNEGEAGETDYWQGYVALGVVPLLATPVLLYLQIHTAEERDTAWEDLVPLTQQRGERLYVHARPCLLVPKAILSTVVHQRSRGSQNGRVIDAEQQDFRPRVIGQAHAWFYPDERLLVVRECYLFEGYHTQHPEEDQVLAVVWHGFERLLRARLPAAERIATPAREDRYRREEWQAFLQAQGYQHFNERAMMKALQEQAR